MSNYGNIDWGTVDESQEFSNLEPGGYICRITSAEWFGEKEYYKLEFDVAEGPQKDYYKAAYDRSGMWFGNFIKSVKPKARGFFKGMLTAFERSNRNFIADRFDGHPDSLRGLMIGLIIGEEEYINKNGEKRVRNYVESQRSIDFIKAGDFAIPALKTLQSKEGQYQPITGDDPKLPF